MQEQVPAVVSSVEEAMPFVQKALSEFMQENKAEVYPDFRKIEHFMERKNRESITRGGRRVYPFMDSRIIGDCLRKMAEIGLLEVVNDNRTNGGVLYRFPRPKQGVVVQSEISSPSYKARLQLIPIDQIAPPIWKRDREDSAIAELMQSIRDNGLVEPIVIRPKRNPPPDFELVCGFRRLTACKRLGMKEIPAIIREDLKDDDVKAMALIFEENHKRQNLDPIEEANLFSAFLSISGSTVSKVARICGVKEEYVRNRLLLLSLPKEIQEKVRDRESGILSVATDIARVLNTAISEGKMKEEEKQRFFEKAKEASLSFDEILTLAKLVASKGFKSAFTTFFMIKDETQKPSEEAPTQPTLDKWIPFTQGGVFQCQCGKRYLASGMVFVERYESSM